MRTEEELRQAGMHFFYRYAAWPESKQVAWVQSNKPESLRRATMQA